MTEWQDLGQVVPDMEYIDIQASNYNPNIDDTITITVTATNQSGNPITNQTYTLKENGETLTPLTTNSNGVATYTYTCDNWGICRFSVKTYSTEIQVNGWKEVKTLANNRIKVYRNDKLINITVQGTWTLTSATSNVLATIDSDYRPSNPNVSIGINTSNANRVYIWTNGNVTLYSLATQTGDTEVQCSFTYPIQ